MRHVLIGLGVLGLLAGCGSEGIGDGEVGTAVSASHHPAYGSGSVLATFGAPGFPEGVAVDGNRVYVSGPANFDMNEATVRVYHRQTGALIDTIQVTHPGADPTDALSSIAVDGRGRLYVLSEAQGVVRLTRHGNHWEQELYAPMPADGLPGCTHGYQLAPDFSDPMMRPACHLLNDLAFDGEGRLFVTDSLRATIYRVDAGGGAMAPWFVSPYLLGGPPFPLGTNGVRVSPDGDDVYFTVTTSPLPELMGRGALYKLPIVNVPAPGDLTAVHYFDPGLGPDGIAFDEDGAIYTALAFANQISILKPNGTETRLTGPAGSPIGYDSPANVAFDGKGSILVTNHALLSGVAADMVVLRVFVNAEGAELFAPCAR